MEPGLLSLNLYTLGLGTGAAREMTREMLRPGQTPGGVFFKAWRITDRDDGFLAYFSCLRLLKGRRIAGARDSKENGGWYRCLSTGIPQQKRVKDKKSPCWIETG